MPLGKQPYIRYRIIDECLSSRTKSFWTKEEILERFGRRDICVTDRTLKTDISSMRYDAQLGYDAPIKFCRRNMGYYYSEEGYSISRFRLNEYDKCFINMAAALLYRFKDTSFHLHFKESMKKFSRMFQLADSEEGELQTHILLEPVHYLKGLEHFVPVKLAILSKYPLSVTCLKNTFIFHPYFLKECESRWHILGYHQEKKRTISLSIDRIEELSPAIVPYIENTFINPEEHFKYTLGLNQCHTVPQKIILSFTPALARFIKTRYIHETQKIILDDNDEFRIELILVPGYELKSMILGWGENVEVVSPAQLRNEITSVIKAIFKKYS